MVTPVPDRMDFPAEEQKVLELWKKLDAFQTSLKQSKDRPRYTFYDGPPFATGLPHYGHILAGTIKVRQLATPSWIMMKFNTCMYLHVLLQECTHRYTYNLYMCIYICGSLC